MILKNVINKIIKNKNKLSPKNKFYKQLNEELANSINKSPFSLSKRKKANIHLIGNLIFPFYSMGAINSLHLFGLDEIIIFCYYLTSKKKYQNVADIGGNIGLHSIILSKFYKSVDCYEPDTIHTNKIKENLKLNKVDNVKIIKKAVSNKSKTLDFIRVLGNTTGSHVAGSKPNPYGRIKKIKIKSIEFKKIIKKYDFIKIDAEGQEGDIILNTKERDWKKTDAILEVGSILNAKRIFKHLKKININMFSQKKNWSKVKTIKDMPSSYKEGSLFISKINNFNFDKV